MSTSVFRWYSEREHPFGPPNDTTFGVTLVDGDRVAALGPRDTRMWISIEYAEQHGLTVPADWRQLR